MEISLSLLSISSYFFLLVVPPVVELLHPPHQGEVALPVLELLQHVAQHRVVLHHLRIDEDWCLLIMCLWWCWWYCV